jgi:hypothetical protein
MPKKEKRKKKRKFKMTDTIPDSMTISSRNLPPLDVVIRYYLNHYLAKLKLHMLPNSRWKYLVFLTEFIHIIIGSFAFLMGLLLPPFWLPYNILFIVIVMLGWEVLGYCFVTKIVSTMTGEEQHVDNFLVPFSSAFIKIYGSAIIGLSLFFSLKPEIAPYNLLKPPLIYILNSLLGFFNSH